MRLLGKSGSVGPSLSFGWPRLQRSRDCSETESSGTQRSGLHSLDIAFPAIHGAERTDRPRSSSGGGVNESRVRSFQFGCHAITALGEFL